MGNGVIRQASTAVLLAIGLLGGTAIMQAPESNAHTCAKVTLKFPVTWQAVPDGTCTDNHHDLGDPGLCHTLKPTVSTTLAEAVMCVEL